MPWFPDFVGAVELAAVTRKSPDAPTRSPNIFRHSNKATDTCSRTSGRGRSWSMTAGGRGSGTQGVAKLRQPKPNLAGRDPCTAENSWPRRTSSIGPSSSCSPASITTGRIFHGPLLWSPSRPTAVPWCFEPTAAHGRSTAVAAAAPILGPGSDQPGDSSPLPDCAWQRRYRRDRADIPPERVPSGTHWSPCPAPRERRSPLVLPRMLQRRGRSHARTMRGDRRRRAVCPGIQLPPLGLPRPSAAGGYRHLRTGSGGLLAAVRVYDDLEPPMKVKRRSHEVSGNFLNPLHVAPTGRRGHDHR